MQKRKKMYKWKKAIFLELNLKLVVTQLFKALFCHCGLVNEDALEPLPVKGFTGQHSGLMVHYGLEAGAAETRGCILTSLKQPNGAITVQTAVQPGLPSAWV